MKLTPNKIYVKMFGGLRINYDNKQIVETEGRAKKVWMLIEYLLANRTHDISQDKLLESSWEDEEFESPFNTLKNLVYRARKQLSELDNEGHTEFILFARNSYTWNNELDCEVDIEEFERNCAYASNKELPNEERLRYYKNAIEIYKGEFLPKSLFANWVISKNAYYSSLYNECIKNSCILLSEMEQYEDMIIICEKAIDIYPFEDEFYKFLLYAYMQTGQHKKARAQYDHLVDLFYKELNVNISDSFRDIYKELIKGSAVETDFNNIKHDLHEAYKDMGAYYCDYDIFKNIYRLQARSMQRTGQSTHVSLITLTDINGDLPDNELLISSMNTLGNTIVNNLRKNDTVAQYSSAQFVIMLPLTTVESANMVMSRIVNRFNNLYKKKNLVTSFRLTSVDPIA